MLLNFALGDPEKVKVIPLFLKMIFLQEWSHFLQKIKIDGILTLIAVYIEGTFEAEKTKKSKIK